MNLLHERGKNTFYFQFLISSKLDTNFLQTFFFKPAPPSVQFPHHLISLHSSFSHKALMQFNFFFKHFLKLFDTETKDCLGRIVFRNRKYFFHEVRDIRKVILNPASGLSAARRTRTNDENELFLTLSEKKLPYSTSKVFR